jgi:hypothetical protein
MTPYGDPRELWRREVGERTRAATGRRQQPEKRVQREIVRALRGLGCYVADLSQPQATMLPEGLPDLWWCHPVWKLSGWIEVKAPGGTLRPAQAVWHEMVREAGQHVAVCRSVGEALGALRTAGAPTRL